MVCTVILDWKLALAVGVAASMVTLSIKVDATVAGEVLADGFNAVKELAIATISNC